MANKILVALGLVVSFSLNGEINSLEIGSNPKEVYVCQSCLPEDKPNLAEEWNTLKTQITSVKEKLFSAFGHRLINSSNSPKLYKVVTDLCEKLNMPVPYVTIFKGNIITNGFSKVFGLDFRANAFATSLIQRLGLISIGSDLLEQLSYDEIRSIIAHELGHIKCYHVLQKIGVAIVVKNVLEKLTGKLIEIIPSGFTESKNPKFKTSVIISLITIPIISRGLINCKISRIFEKEADLKALSLTHDKDSLINGLDKIHEITHENFEKSILGKTLQLFSIHPTNKQRAEYLTLEAAKLGA